MHNPKFKKTAALVLLSFATSSLGLAQQPQSTATPTQRTSNAELPDAPQVQIAQAQQAPDPRFGTNAPSANTAPATQSADQNAATQDNAQQSAPANAQDNAQQPAQATDNTPSVRTRPDQNSNAQQQPAQTQEPVGAATAEKGRTRGGVASRPAGVAIAPAKQKRRRSILIKTAAILAGAAAIGTVYGLSKASPSKPPGATTTTTGAAH